MTAMCADLIDRSAIAVPDPEWVWAADGGVVIARVVIALTDIGTGLGDGLRVHRRHQPSSCRPGKDPWCYRRGKSRSCRTPPAPLRSPAGQAFSSEYDCNPSIIPDDQRGSAPAEECPDGREDA
jgi:hypothetical protein